MIRELVLQGGGLTFVAALPETGCPEVLYFGKGMGAPQLRTLGAGRNNGMGAGNDVDVLNAVLMPTGGLGFFGWPAILGRRDGVSPTIQFSNWQVQASESNAKLKASDGIAGLEIEISLRLAHGLLSNAVTLHKRLRPWLHATQGQFHLVPEAGRYVWASVSKNKIVIILAQADFMKVEHAARLMVQHELRGQWHIAACHPKQLAEQRVLHDQHELLSGKTKFDIRCLAEGGLVLPTLLPQTAMILELEPVRG